MKAYDIAKHGYIVNEAALSELARRYADGIAATEGVRATYLQVLVAHTKQELGRAAASASSEQQLAAIDSVHSGLYSIILDAITTEDIAADDSLEKAESKRRSRERNRRTTFARTSKSVLAHWVRAGGKIHTLDPAKVTKEALRVQASPTEESVDSIVQKAEGTLERAVRVLVVQDAEAAQELVNEITQRLQAIVTPPKPLTSTRRRVGSLTLNPH